MLNLGKYQQTRMNEMKLLALTDKNGHSVECLGDCVHGGMYVVVCEDPDKNFGLSGYMQKGRLPSTWADVVTHAKQRNETRDKYAITSPIVSIENVPAWPH
jgi:hypothetical protein